MIYAPSLACARQLYLGEDIANLIEGKMPFLHVDFMDGHHVPNFCMSYDAVKEIRRLFPQACLDVHLMVDNPELCVERCRSLGLSYLSFVPETAQSPRDLLREIRALGIKAGFVINPGQAVCDFEDLLNFSDMVVVMSIQPGGVKRPFLEECYEKVRQLAAIREEKALRYLISIDGGVNLERGKKLMHCGADVLVLGYYAIFKEERPLSASCRDFIDQMEQSGTVIE